MVEQVVLAVGAEAALVEEQVVVDHLVELVEMVLYFYTTKKGEIKWLHMQ
jgi:hypothetical protein